MPVPENAPLSASRQLTLLASTLEQPPFDLLGPNIRFAMRAQVLSLQGFIDLAAERQAEAPR